MSTQIRSNVQLLGGILLNAATKSLEIKLAGAVTTSELPFVTSYFDFDQTDFNLSAAAESDGTSNGGTAVAVVAAPVSGTRKLNYISVVNIDTAAATLTVQYNNNGTRRTIFKVALAVGDQVSFTDVDGWTVFDANGAEKFTSPIGANTITLAMLAQIGTASVLGRNTAGTGNVEVLTTLPNGVQDNITRLGTITSAGNVALLNAGNVFTANQVINAGTDSTVIYRASGVTKGYVGVQSAGGFITGGVANSIFFRSESVGFEWSADSGSTKHMTLSTAGLLTVNGTLAVSGTGTLMAALNTTHANGGYLALQRSGTDKAYWGSAKSVLSGSLAADDYALYSGAGLYLSANGGTISFASGSTVNATLSSAGLLSVKGFGSHSFTAGGNGLNSVSVENTTAGTAAGSRISLLIEGSATRLILDAYSDSYTTSGAQIAGGALVGGLGAGGVSLLANHASGDIRGYVGGANLKFKIQASDGHTYTDNGSVSSLSDVRTKRKVGEFTAGLAAIQGIVSGDLQRWMHNKMDVTVKGKRVQIPRSSRPFVGASAQTIKQFVPEAVHEDPETGLLAVDTAPIWWAGMRAIKELADRVAALEAA